jgi:hypothetical protein
LVERHQRIETYQLELENVPEADVLETDAERRVVKHQRGAAPVH